MRLFLLTFDISYGVSHRGNLLGITSFKIEDAENLNFAIAAEDFWAKAAKKRRSRRKSDDFDPAPEN